MEQERERTHVQAVGAERNFPALARRAVQAERERVGGRNQSIGYTFSQAPVAGTSGVGMAAGLGGAGVGGRRKKWLVLVVPPAVLPHSPPPAQVRFLLRACVCGRLLIDCLSADLGIRERLWRQRSLLWRNPPPSPTDGASTLASPWPSPLHILTLFVTAPDSALSHRARVLPSLDRRSVAVPLSPERATTAVGVPGPAGLSGPVGRRDEAAIGRGDLERALVCVL